jgi:hypothetical protein
MFITSSICMARRATSIGKTVSVLVNTIWYLVFDLQINIIHQINLVITMYTTFICDLPKEIEKVHAVF